ncbi:hypothetical protein [Absidia glauca]|uniref:Uncharacterized protein n=1 Tax=Absidia glauca TaxID=4829 RepID=A0A163JEA0_ABSGL|nr:hypothetical protein [Absidia glauca]
MNEKEPAPPLPTTKTSDDTNGDNLTDMVDKASSELADRYKVERIATPLINHVQQQCNQCSNQIQDTERVTIQIQQDTQSCREALATLQEQSESLQKAFSTIDKLEVLVNQMNSTLVQVTANVDEMEKTVQSSIQQKSALPIPFRFSKRSDSPLQPYFPPPQPMIELGTRSIFKVPSLSDFELHFFGCPRPPLIYAESFSDSGATDNYASSRLMAVAQLSQVVANRSVETAGGEIITIDKKIQLLVSLDGLSTMTAASAKDQDMAEQQQQGIDNLMQAVLQMIEKLTNTQTRQRDVQRIQQEHLQHLGSTMNGGPQTGLVKTRLPEVFNGEHCAKTVENWLATLKNFFYATPVSLLRDEALLWWRNLTRGGTDASEPDNFLASQVAILDINNWRCSSGGLPMLYALPSRPPSSPTPSPSHPASFLLAPQDLVQNPDSKGSTPVTPCPHALPRSSLYPLSR